MKVKGIAASPGITVGEVFLVKNPDIPVENTKVSDTKKEVALFENALEKAVNQIRQIKEKALKNLSEEEASVFDAHIQIAQDPLMVNEIKNLISHQKVNSIFATSQTSQKYAKMFSDMEDKYMRERAADVADVSQRIINNLANVENFDVSSLTKEVIIVSEDLTPSDTAQLNKKYVKGFATNTGGATSHAAIIAKSLGIPAVLGVSHLTNQVKAGDQIALDGSAGVVYLNLSERETRDISQKQKLFEKEKASWQLLKGKDTVSSDNHKVILAGNIASVSDAQAVVENDGQAIGLMRSEFLYMDSPRWPTEEEQFGSYKKVLESMNGKQVVVRTLDIGGDKHLSYYNFPKEMNPFLGYRAIRLSLDQEDMFRVQLRALIRASFYGKLGVMFPMIATISEFKKAKSILCEEYDKLKAQKVQVARLEDIEIGMMVELPAATMLVDLFANYADFFSIGTNDLIQYTMAADRMSEKVAYLYQPLNPSVLRAIKMVIDKAHSKNKWVGMCGEMAGDANAVPLLLGMGLDEFSVSPTLILKTKKLISQTSFRDSQTLVQKAINLETEEEVLKLIGDHFQK